MPASLVQPLVQTPATTLRRAPLPFPSAGLAYGHDGAASADVLGLQTKRAHELRAAQADEGAARRQAGLQVADGEGGVKTARGGESFRQGPSASTASNFDPTPTVCSPAYLTPYHPQSVVFALKLSRGGNAREHHMARARRVRKERHLTAWALMAARIPSHPIPARVTLTRHACRALDSDNLQGAFKAIRDQVATHFGFDDRNPNVTWAYGARYAKNPSVEITIEWGAQ
jgi:hypothetical protein